jgi:hypothetical protein
MWKSNREKHLIAGALIYAVMLGLCFVLNVQYVKGTIIALIATLIAACAVEYKDKLWGGKFDWLDVVATILVPVIVSAILLIVTRT